MIPKARIDRSVRYRFRKREVNAVEKPLYSRSRRYPRSEVSVPAWVLFTQRWLLWPLATAVVLAVIGMGLYILKSPTTLPIRHVFIEGELHHIDPTLLEKTLIPYVKGGFFSIDTQWVIAATRNLTWLDRVSIRRVWPDTLKINVKEHQAVARWADKGLINQRGEWFDAPLDSANMAKLPELVGPQENLAEIVTEFNELNKMLKGTSLGVTKLVQDKRKTYQLTLSDGVVLLLGRKEVNVRLGRFIRIYKTKLSDKMQSIEQVDLRYPNGFAVRWKSSPPLSVSDGDGTKI